MTTIRVRPLRARDWALYRDVRLAALHDAPDAFGSTYAGERALPERVWRERLVLRDQFVAEDADGACGLAGLAPAGPRAAELVSLWVRPAARGHGAGDLLVRAVLRCAGDRGLTSLRLWVTRGNDRAEHLYLRHGFRRTGEAQPVREGEERLEFAMARPVLRGGPPPEGAR